MQKILACRRPPIVNGRNTDESWILHDYGALIIIFLSLSLSLSLPVSVSMFPFLLPPFASFPPSLPPFLPPLLPPSPPPSFFPFSLPSRSRGREGVSVTDLRFQPLIWHPGRYAHTHRLEIAGFYTLFHRANLRVSKVVEQCRLSHTTLT